MADELILQIQASLSAVHAANETASRWLEDRNAPPEVHYLANLAVEELVTNCIKYGYEDSGKHMIEVKLQISANELALTVTDDGRPFNPLELPEPDIHLPIEDRPIGGLGIYLLRRMSDHMDYVRAAGRNSVTLRKSMGNSPIRPGTRHDKT